MHPQMKNSPLKVEDHSVTDLQQYLRETVQWLNSRFLLQPGVPYHPHQPVYGFLPQYLSHFRLAYALMRRVRQLSFSSFIDIGGAEGYFPNLVKQLYGDSRPVYNLDISVSVVSTSRQFYQLNGLVANIEKLPLPDNSVDLVLCNDVIEHVPDPKKAVQELERVAAKYLIVATDEISLGVEDQSFEPDFSHPHGHIHRFTKEDMYDIMSQDILLETFRSTLLHILIEQGKMHGTWRLLQSLLRFIPVLVENLRGDGREMYWMSFKYLVRHILLSIATAISPDKEGWTRRRLVDDLITDEWLVIRFPRHALSLVAIKDCGGAGLPAPITEPAMDYELLEAMWSRSGVDKSVLGCDSEGHIYLLRPEALKQ